MGQCASTQKQTRWHICKKFHRRWLFCLELNQNLVEQVVASGSVEHGDGGAGVRRLDQHGRHPVRCCLRHSSWPAERRPGGLYSLKFGLCCVDSFGSCSFKFVHYNVFKLVPTNQVTTPKEELIAWQSRPMEIVARWLSNHSLSSCILITLLFQIYLVWTRFLCITVQTIATIFECTL